MTLSRSNLLGSEDSLFNEGFSHYERGQLDRAFQIFGQLIAVNPKHFDAQYLSALILLKRQQFAESIHYLSVTLSLKPDHPPSLRYLALSLSKVGHFEQALEAASRLVDLTQGAVEAYSLLAQIQGGQGDQGACLRTWIKLGSLEPKSAQIKNNIGVICHQMGDFSAALEHYKQAQELDPKDAKIYFNMAASLEKLGAFDAAIQSYGLAIENDSNYKDAFFNLGLLWIQVGQFDKAIECFDQVLLMDPGMTLAYLNKAVASQKLKLFASAQESLETAMQLDPASPLICFNLATVLQDKRALQASAEMYRRALDLDPSHVNAWCNLGDVLHDLQNPKQAIHCYLKALDLEPGSIRASYHLSLSYLLDAQFEKGWPLFELRRQYEASFLSIQSELGGHTQPMWLGQEALEGKSLLVMSEQGLGDSIQFVRYMPHLKKLGARVVLQTPRNLMALFSAVEGVSHWVASDEEAPPCDYYVPMMSLPLVLASMVKEIPVATPYLQAPSTLIEKWHHRLDPKTKPRVGLVWSGGERIDQPWSWAVNKRRNIPLQLFASLKHPGIDFISIQKGSWALQELAELKERDWDGPELLDPMAEIVDFAETAALIEQLDLLISVDTSSAHLAGALGKPVWMLNRFDTCWRWQLDRSDTPWYPSMKIYRQERLDDWRGVIGRVSADLFAHFELEPPLSKA